jgi:myosin heavy subunit
VTLLVNKETKKIVGALIYNYLLEKSRIPNPAKNERNYNIFYHLLKSGDEKILSELGLTDKKVADFKYLSVSGCEEVKTVDDAALFVEVNESFKVMHFRKDDIDSIWKIVAGVLMMGNIDFDDAKLDDSIHLITLFFYYFTFF